MCSVIQRPNLKLLCEPGLLGGTESLLETVGLKKITECVMTNKCVGSEFRTWALVRASDFRPSNYGFHPRLVLSHIFRFIFSGNFLYIALHY